jgi:hypothetical protein
MLLAALALILVVCAGPAAAQDEPVALDKIPKAVMDALLARFPQAKIDTCTRTTEDGEVVYDIEFRQEGRKCEADITGKGTYINFEKAIQAASLPKAVRSAIEKRYPKSVLKEIMEETEVHGTSEKLSAFEVVLVTAGKKDVEVRVSPDGKILEDTGTEAKKEK